MSIRVSHRHFGKVEHVRHDVNDGPYDDGPCRSLVEGDALVKGDDVAERGTAQEGDEVPADGKEDEDDVHMKNHGGSASDGWNENEKMQN